MIISTTQPCVVIYTSNFLQNSKDKDFADGNHSQHAAICLETTQFNNAVNMIGQDSWPKEEDVYLTPGNTYR